MCLTYLVQNHAKVYIVNAPTSINFYLLLSTVTNIYLFTLSPKGDVTTRIAYEPISACARKCFLVIGQSIAPSMTSFLG